MILEKMRIIGYSIYRMFTFREEKII